MKTSFFSTFLIAGLLLIQFISCDVNIDSGKEDQKYNDVYNLNLRDDGPAGGLIFYINPNADEDGWKYMEAAPVGRESSLIWQSEEDPYPEIGDSVKGTAIGSGKSNTESIILWLVENSQNTDKAATYSDELSYEYNSVTYNDWFLPAKDELVEMAWILHRIKYEEGATVYNPDYTTAVGSFSSTDYWTSTEETNSAAWTLYFGNGSVHGSAGKQYARIVRPVRVF